MDDELSTERKTTESDLIPIRVAVISNVLLEPYLDAHLTTELRLLGYRADVTPIAFEECYGKELLDRLTSSDYAVVALNLDALAPNLLNELLSRERDIRKFALDAAAVSNTLCDYLTQNITARILWFDYEDYYLQISAVIGDTASWEIADRINLLFGEDKTDEIKIMDLRKIIASVGLHNAYDNKSKYRWNAPYSEALIAGIASEIAKQILIDKGVTKKCLVLDCDNVLWGGIVSEDGIENIKLGGFGSGRAYQEFQRFVLSLYNMGTIITVCSRNDLSTITGVFASHKEMILQEKHIACFQVNWEHKVDNIRRIADLLNVSLDSIVYVDDSRFEIEAVKALLPEVTAILFDKNSICETLTCFNLSTGHNPNDIEKRTLTYKSNSKREALKNDAESIERYLSQLQTEVDIHAASISDLSRISELSQRTNKCTNGKRYATNELKVRFASRGYKLFAVRVSDRFGDLGLVGAIGLEGGALDLFCLSCRALGRNVERHMSRFVEEMTPNIDASSS